MTKIVLADMGDYATLYIDGRFETQMRAYEFDFEYGIEIVGRYPDFIFERVEVDLDWLEEQNYEMPDNLSDVVYDV